MRDKRLIAAGIAVAIVAVAARHPTTSLTLITHDAGDPAPHQLKAAIDLGIAGVSILYTWTGSTLH